MQYMPDYRKQKAWFNVISILTPEEAGEVAQGKMESVVLSSSEVYQPQQRHKQDALEGETVPLISWV